MRRIGEVLLWSVLAAAFIGPGTVTTAASAGAGFGYSLLWALLFSTVACLVLQEAAARLTISGGVDLAVALARRYPSGARRVGMLVLVLGAVVVGCAAYEAGNILGGVAGAQLLRQASPERWTALLGAVAAVLLWFNSPQRVARMLAALVAVMGSAFLYTSWLLRPELEAIVRGLTVPALPEGSAVLALGLVGTTVVPYNLFLGSGLAGRGRLADTRFGIAVAVGLGGAISMAVLVVGAALDGSFGYAELSSVLVERLGDWASPLLGLGLLAAGLSSAVTAPLAAALTARGLSGAAAEKAWDARGWKYRTVWLGVLAFGVAVGVSGARPVPVIVLAQALNGILLPLVAAFLFVAVNDRRQLGEAAINGRLANVLTAAVVGVSLVLGLNGLGKALVAATGSAPIDQRTLLLVAAALAAVAGIPILRAISRGRRP